MRAKEDKIRLLCISGVLAAIIYIFTAFFHIPSHTGYTHVGDAFIYLAGSLLPTPYAVAASAAGGMLADLLGRVLFAPSEIPAGVLLSLLGAPFFLALLMGRRKADAGM